MVILPTIFQSYGTKHTQYAIISPSFMVGKKIDKLKKKKQNMKQYGTLNLSKKS